MPAKDKHTLLEMPGAKVAAGTAGKQITQNREAFRASVGQMNGPSAGSGTYNGTGGTSEPTIAYPVGPGRPRVMGRGGAFGTPEHIGRQPINYDETIPTGDY